MAGEGGPSGSEPGQKLSFHCPTLCWVSTGISKEGKFKDDLTLVTTEQPFCALGLRPLGILGSYIAKAPGGSMQQDLQPQRGQTWERMVVSSVFKKSYCFLVPHQLWITQGPVWEVDDGLCITLVLNVFDMLIRTRFMHAGLGVSLGVRSS